MKNPVVSAPIVGATKPHHLADAVAALELLRLRSYAVIVSEEQSPPGCKREGGHGGWRAHRPGPITQLYEAPPARSAMETRRRLARTLC